MRYLLVSDIKLPYTENEGEAILQAAGRLKRAGLSLRDAELCVYKRSLDARGRENISFVYSVLVCGEFGKLGSKCVSLRISEINDPYADISFAAGNETPGGRILVVGMGPC